MSHDTKEQFFAYVTGDLRDILKHDRDDFVSFLQHYHPEVFNALLQLDKPTKKIPRLLDAGTGRRGAA